MPITKQTISIIGATHPVARQIALGICTNNYRLLLFDEDTEAAIDLALQIKAAHHQADTEAVSCQHIASWEADIIIFAIPPTVMVYAAEKIRAVAVQKTVLIISNQKESEPGQSMEQLLPHSKIVFLNDAGNLRNGQTGVQIHSRCSEALETAASLVMSSRLVLTVSHMPQTESSL